MLRGASTIWLAALLGCQPGASPASSETGTETTDGPPTSTTSGGAVSEPSATSSTGGAVDSTGEGTARWCDLVEPSPLVCADFDGPLEDWLPPSNPPVVETTEDASVASSPPRSLRFDVAHEFQTAALDGEYVWAGPLDAWPARMHGVFSVYFPESCSTHGMIRLGVAAATGEPLLLSVVLGPESVTVWSDEPDSFEQPWYEPLNLPLDEWIDVQISIDFADESATLRIGDDTASFPTLWEIAVGFQIAEVHARFGTGASYKSTIDCTYYMDNVAFVLE